MRKSAAERACDQRQSRAICATNGAAPWHDTATV